MLKLGVARSKGCIADIPRRILLAEATFCPHGRWMGQMARNLLMACEDAAVLPRFVLHDRDKPLAWNSDAVLTTAQASPLAPLDPTGGNPDQGLQIECEQFLGGLFSPYHRKAA